MVAYLSSLRLQPLLNALPGGVAQGLIWGVMALGVYLTFRMLGFSDLSVDGSIATGGAVTVVLILKGVNPELSLIACFVAGALAGIVTALLNTKLGIPAILAGILTQISLYSINLKILGKANQAINTTKVNLLFSSNIKLIGKTILIAGVVCVLLISLIYWYLGTEQGSGIRATGTNPHMAKAQGINTDNMTIITLALSNGLVALAGGILAQYQAYADINMGRGAIVIGLAAVIIGEVIGEAVMGKHLNFYGRLVFVVIGGIIYYSVYVFVLWLKFPSSLMKLLTAVVVAIFLAVPYLRAQSKSSFAHLKRVNKKKAKEAK
ncbi:MAG: ABC transporter permease [Erysipelotrichaceae bacterium]|nr:ABC transporter permease [Erysipelotrichaceae bacterium]